MWNMQDVTQQIMAKTKINENKLNIQNLEVENRALSKGKKVLFLCPKHKQDEKDF